MDMKKPFKKVKGLIEDLLRPPSRQSTRTSPARSPRTSEELDAVPAPTVYNNNANQNANSGDGNIINNNPNFNFGSNSRPVVTYAPVTNINAPAPNPSVCDIHDF